MSGLRDAAAMLVESGKALGHLEQARTTDTILSGLITLALGDANADEPFAATCKRLQATRDRIRAELPGYERMAKAAQDRAAELVAEAEHPGAALARRLVATVHGARAAWRGSR